MHYRSELEIRKNLGTDTTGVRVSMSQIYDKLGDATTAEMLLNDNYEI